MIITRSPLRISMGGGGTDLPSYYEKHGGFLIAGAIDKYVYLTLHNTFRQELIIKYSELEHVKNVDEVKHPIIREALKLYDSYDNPHLEIASMADIPAGTGLGSSGSFTTALLKGLNVLNRRLIHPQELAAEACKIEIDILKEPIGKQDQYIASYGGITCFEFEPDGTVEAWPLNINKETVYQLEDNLLLFFTGFSRMASNILKEQDDKSKKSEKEMIENLHFIKSLGMEGKEALEMGDLRHFGRLMHTHWENKKKRSRNMTKDSIDEWYEVAMQNGALGGKLVGAGGGGFLMFYTEEHALLRKAMTGLGLQEVRFRFDFEGTKVVTES